LYSCKHAITIQQQRTSIARKQAMTICYNTLGMPVVVIPEAGHFFHGKLLVLRQLVQTRLKAL
jgi:alpha/beta superfamily hydrolase